MRRDLGVAQYLADRTAEALLAIGQPPDPESKGHHEANGKGKYRQIFGLWELHLLAIFILVTVGFGSSIGGAST